ncbi:hypothetical protein AB9M62_57115 [Bacillales bacterium AN1005]
MTDELENYSDSKDYFIKNFKVSIKQPSFKQIIKIKSEIKSKRSVDDLKLMKISTQSRVERLRIFSSVLTAITVTVTVVGIVLNNSLEKEYFIFSLLGLALIAVIASYYLMVQMGTATLLNELVIQIYEEEKDKQNDEQEKKNLIKEDNVDVLLSDEENDDLPDTEE